MDKRLDFIFLRLFLLMKLGMIYFILLLAGGFILGLSPAATAILSLYHEFKLNTTQYQFKTAWSYFKKNFVQANVVLFLCVFLGAILSYGVFLLVQMPQDLFILGLTVLDSLLVLYISLVYIIYLKLQVYYDFSVKNALKLSAISVFFDFFAMIKVVLGSVICFLLIRYVSLLIVVFLPILWLIFIFDVLEPIYRQVDQKMVTS